MTIVEEKLFIKGSVKLSDRILLLEDGTVFKEKDGSLIDTTESGFYQQG